MRFLHLMYIHILIIFGSKSAKESAKYKISFVIVFTWDNYKYRLAQVCTVHNEHVAWLSAMMIIARYISKQNKVQTSSDLHNSCIPGKSVYIPKEEAILCYT